jgi:hypothetical protein
MLPLPPAITPPCGAASKPGITENKPIRLDRSWFLIRLLMISCNADVLYLKGLFFGSKILY